MKNNQFRFLEKLKQGKAQFLVLAAFAVIISFVYSPLISADESPLSGIEITYGNKAGYDDNNDGIEAINGTIDFEVKGAISGGDAATRWEIKNIGSGSITALCQGTEQLCGLLGLKPSSEKWDDPLYVRYGENGAAKNSIINAWVLYRSSGDAPQFHYSTQFNFTAGFLDEDESKNIMPQQSTNSSSSPDNQEPDPVSNSKTEVDNQSKNFGKTRFLQDDLMQLQAEIGKPVKWRRRIILEAEAENLSLEIPEKSSGIAVNSGNSSVPENKIRKGINNRLAINERIREAVIEYETEAPRKEEHQPLPSKKIVKIISDVHYENVLAHSDITETAKEGIKLYWLNNDSRELFENISYIDSDNNGLAERIEWIVPHLSNQTFEIELTILDVQSFPTVGGEWAVRFTTAGTSNLTISASNGTSYAEQYNDDASTPNDLDFAELKCGDEVLFNKKNSISQQNIYMTDEYGNKLKISDTIGKSQKIKSILVEDYNCDNETAQWIVKVLTPGKHAQKFEFGNLVAYANNFALSGLIFVDNTNDDFAQGTLLMTNISGSGANANVTLNSTAINTFLAYNTTGNFTSRVFDTGQKEAVFDKIAWSSALPNSSDIMGMAMDGSTSSDIGAFYRNRSFSVNPAQANLAGNFNFVNLLTYSIPAGWDYGDIAGFGWDHDATQDIYAFFRNGSVARDLTQADLTTNIAFTSTSAFTIPAGFNASNIIGAGIDTGATQTALFFKNGSFVVAASELPPFNFNTVRRFTIPADFSTEDVVGFEHDNGQADMALFFRNGSYVANTNVANFGADIAFNAVFSVSYPHVNSTEYANITLQTRTSNDSIAFTPWSSTYTEADGIQAIEARDGRYIQYKAVFSTPDKYITPFLENVSINYSDPKAPDANASINSTFPRVNEIINFTANASDIFGLSACQFIDNQSANGAKRFFNASLTGNIGECSQNFIISRTRGNVINFSLIINDTYDNKNQTDFILEVANTPIGFHSILYPPNGIISNNQPLNLNVTFQQDADNDPITISYYINGALNQTSQHNTTLNASDGIYLLNASISDGFSTTANTTAQFTIDTLKPALQSRSPSNNSFSMPDTVFKFTAADQNAYTASLYFNRTGIWTRNQTLNFTSGIEDAFNTTTINESFIVWGIFLDDTAGNPYFTENFTLRIDGTIPSIISSINNSAPRYSEAVNITANVSDETSLGSCQFITNMSLSGEKDYTNKTVSGTSDQCSQDFIISLIAGSVINFTVIVNDTAGNINHSVNSTEGAYAIGHIVTVQTTSEAMPPSIKIFFNMTNPRVNDMINFTANITDNFGLVSANITYNMSGEVTKINFSLGDTSAEVSNATKITAARGNVINFTMYATDTSNNIHQNSSLITVEDTLGVAQISLNMTPPKENHFINISASCMDPDSDISFGIISYNISGNPSLDFPFNLEGSGTRGDFSKTTAINLTKGNAINFTVFCNDTFGLIYQNSLLQIVADGVIPRINSTINNSAPKYNEVVNLSGDISDEALLDSCQFITNQSGFNQYINKTVLGTSGQCSQDFVIALTRNNVINFTIIVNDTGNNLNQSGQLITIANTPAAQPAILYPADGLETREQPLSLNVTFAKDADNDPISISYYINGKLNQTSSANTTLNASEGEYILNVSLWDNSNPMATSSNATTMFFLDYSPPQVILLAPLNHSVENESIVSFSFNVIDSYTIANCSLLINGQQRTASASISKDSSNMIQFSLQNGNYDWSISCYDQAGNSNISEFRNITVNTPPLLPTKFIDTTDTDFGQGTLFKTNISGSGNDANVTLNYSIISTFPSYNTPGNFTSRLFDTGASNTFIQKIKWAVSLPNSSDVLGYAMDTGANQIAVFYRNGSYGADLSQAGIVSNVDFTGQLRGYTLEAGFEYDDIVSFGWDDDASGFIYALFRNGSVLRSAAIATLAGTDISFNNGVSAWTIPAGFNASDITGFAIDSASTDSAVFFGNGSYASIATSEGPAFNFDTVLAFSLPAGFDAEDSIGTAIDRATDDIAMFFRNGSFVVDGTQLDFTTDMAFTDGVLTALYQPDANITEQTNITIQTRASNDSIVFTDWSGAYSNNEESAVETLMARYIQYKAVFYSQDRYVTPYLENATINYTETNNPRIDFSYPTPASGSFLRYDYVYVNTSIFDEHSIERCRLELDGANQSMLISRDGRDASCFINKSGLSEGTHNFRVYANDSFGNANSTETISVTIDLTAPAVDSFTITPSPAGFTIDNVAVNFTVSDINIDGSIVSVSYPNSTTFAVYSSNFTLTTTNLSVPGNYSLTLIANDSAGNSVTVADYLIVNDVTAPNISLSSPLNSTISRSNVVFNYVPQDDYNVSNCTLVLDSILNSTNNSIQESALNSFTAILPEGIHNWSVQCTDSYSNTGISESRAITIDESAPSITLLHPVNDFNSTLDFINFNWTMADNFDSSISCNVSLNGIVSGFDIANESGIYANLSVSSIDEGANRWNVTCIDDANNANTSATYNFTIVKGPGDVNISFDANLETVNLRWADIPYAESYNIYIIDSYADNFGALPNISGLTGKNYTDTGASGKSSRFYRIAAVKGSANGTSKTMGKMSFELLNNSGSMTDFNLISIPLNLTSFMLNNGSNNGSDLATKPSNCVKTLWGYNSTTAEFKRTDYDGGVWIPAAGSENFTSLEAGRGYWAEVNQSCSLTFVGAVPSSNKTTGLDAGWNVLGWHSTNFSKLPRDFQPSYPVVVNPANSVRAIDRYNPATDRFEVTIHFVVSGNDWGWFPSSANRDFTGLEPGRGYYFDVNEPAVWAHQPNTEK